MQKKNSVIKNYIFSPDKYFLSEDSHQNSIEILLYRLPLRQNKDFSYLFLLRK